MNYKNAHFTHPLHMVNGFIIWAFWLTLVYAGLSLSCMATPSPETLAPYSWINIALLVFTLLITALLVWLALCCWRSISPQNQAQHENVDKQTRFTLRVATAVYGFGAAATLIGVIPMVMLSPCL